MIRSAATYFDARRGLSMDQSQMLSAKAVQSSLEGREARIAAWFSARMPHARDVAVEAVTPPPPASGFSAENYFIDLAWSEAGELRRERFVLRRQSAEKPMFPGRDFAHERLAQDILGRSGVAPTPRVFGYEDDLAVLDGRFYVMSFIPGRVPPDNPQYHLEGWVKDLDVPSRRALWFDGLARLGRLHRATHGMAGLEFLSRSGAGEGEFAHNLAYWEDHYRGSSRGRPLPLMERTAAWLRANLPEERRPVLSWGDARIGNMLFDGAGRCVGMIDWELVTLGDPLQDFAYWLYADDHFAEIAGGALDGWPSRTDSIVAYEAAWGAKVDPERLKFYRIYAGYWIVCTLSRLIEIKKAVGQMPAALKVDEALSPVAFLKRELGGVA